MPNVGIQEAPSAPGRRERNKLQKRARIVEAARTLFQQQGYAATTTQQIAATADIGTGTLFLYAQAKEDLLVMVFRDEMLETFLTILSGLPAAPTVADQLMTVFDRMADYHARDGELARLLLRELVVPSATGCRTEIDELMDTIYGGLGNIIGAAGIENSALVARSAFALYYFALISWLGTREDRKRCMEQLHEQLRHLMAKGARGD